MSHKLSIADYYYNQRRIAERYGINENHAGCYICYYPNERFCAGCKRAATCNKIRECEEENENEM